MSKAVVIADITKQDMINLKLHETINTTCGISIMKVMSGWLYDCWDYEFDKAKTGVFVPFNI